MIKRLLYLTYIDLEGAPATGSSVRPLKMKEAFEQLAAEGELLREVKVFDGAANRIPLRRERVGEIRRIVSSWRPDACYIEPPSGPFFFEGDVTLIRDLCRAGIPTSLFYRDAYWRYPEYSEGAGMSVKDRLKRFVVKKMSIHQWNVFRENLTRIYFPSETMGAEFDCPRKDVLPPGGFVTELSKGSAPTGPVQCIFVGGAAVNHGTILTLDAFAALNRERVRAKLFYICPEAQWKALGIDADKYKDWLEVIHTSGDENLKPYYERSDVALLTAPRTFYRDFAVPIKLYEYMSYHKPMLVTDCTETARCVEENRVGWVTKADVESVTKKLAFLCEHPDEIRMVAARMPDALEQNLWMRRAEKVLRDMDKEKPWRR